MQLKSKVRNLANKSFMACHFVVTSHGYRDIWGSDTDLDTVWSEVYFTVSMPRSKEQSLLASELQ